MIKFQDHIATLEKVLPTEVQLRDDEHMLKDQLEQLKNALDNASHAAPETSLPVVENLELALQSLVKKALEHDDQASKPSTAISHDDLDRSIPSALSDFSSVLSEKKKRLSDQVQVNTVAPEIQIISQSLQQLPEQLPVNVLDQQAQLEDLQSQRLRLENLITKIPEGDNNDELRQKSSWDLSRLKDILKNLGDVLGDKLAALAAFKAARQDAEQQLLTITSSNVENEPVDQAINRLKLDEDSLRNLTAVVEQVDRTALDADEQKEHDELLQRLNKATELLEVNQFF